MPSTNVSNFRNNAFEYFNRAVQFNEIINVSTKNGNAVVMSEEDYNGLIETAYINSLPSVVEDIQEAKENSNNPEYWLSEEEIDL